MTLAPGDRLGSYEIVERAGAGGMGAVYKAYQAALGRYVAIKILPPQTAGDPTFTERFAAEAKAIGKLRHPNIVTAFDFAQQGDMAYLVSDFIDGGTLAEQIGAPLPLDYAIGVLTPVASALDYAHARGVVHRDVKPQNVLMTHDGAPVLTDFGLAKIVGPGSGVTQAGTLMGTAEYMAPECASGAEAAGPAADQYALALIAYEMLVGRHPFPADNPLSALMAHVNKPVPIPSELGVTLPPGVEAALLRGLAKRPEQRFARCGDLARALAGSIAPVMAPPTAPAQPAGTASGPAAPPPATAMASPSALVRPPDSTPPVSRPAAAATAPPPRPLPAAPPWWRRKRVLLLPALLVVLLVVGSLRERGLVAAIAGRGTAAPTPTAVNPGGAPSERRTPAPSTRAPTAAPTATRAATAPPTGTPLPIPTTTPLAMPAADQGNTPATATVIQPGTVYSGTIAPPTDVDWYRFAVSGAQRITVELRADTPGLAVALFAASTGTTGGGTLLAEETDTGGGARIAYDAPGPGTYALRIRAAREITSDYRFTVLVR